MLNVLRRVDAAGAVGLRRLVGVMRVSSSAFRRQRLARRPCLERDHAKARIVGVGRVRERDRERPDRAGDELLALDEALNRLRLGLACRLFHREFKRLHDDGSQRLADLHHFLPGCILVPGMQGTVACSEAVRRVKSSSQTRHLRTC